MSNYNEKVRWWIQWKLKFRFSDKKYTGWFNHLEFRTKKEARNYLIKNEGGFYPSGIYKYRIIKVK